MMGLRLRAAGRKGVLAFAFIALATPNWMAGPLTWWPVTRLDLASRGEVVIGAVYVLLIIALGVWALGLGLTPHGFTLVILRLKRAWPMSGLVLGLVVWLCVRVRWDVSWAEAALASVALLWWWMLYSVVVGEALEARVVMGLLVLAAGLHALVGLGQFALQSDMGWQVLGEERLDPIVGGMTVIEIDSQRILRAYGLARHPNTVGGLLALGALAAASGAWVTPSARARWLYLAALGTITAGLVVTFSRSAWLGALAGGAMLGWAAHSRLKRFEQGVPWARPGLLMLGLISVIVAVFVVARPELFTARLLGGLSQRFQLEQGSLMARAQSLHMAWALIHQAPLFGVGVRGYLWAGARLTDAPLELVHNVPVLLWAEGGLGAALMWLGLWGIMVWAAWRGRPSPPGLRATLAWMTCLQVANQFNYYLAPAQNLQAPTLLGLVCGVWAVNFACPTSADRPAAQAGNAD